MNKVSRYVLLLGTSLESPQILDQAIDLLSQHGEVERTSQCVLGASVNAGDLRNFYNQALILATAFKRDALHKQLKQIEGELGRGSQEGHCVIDIDLACECDAHGIVLWRDDAKLGHPLFVRLMHDVLGQLRGPETFN